MAYISVFCTSTVHFCPVIVNYYTLDHIIQQYKIPSKWVQECNLAQFLYSSSFSPYKSILSKNTEKETCQAERTERYLNDGIPF